MIVLKVCAGPSERRPPGFQLRLGMEIRLGGGGVKRRGTKTCVLGTAPAHLVK